MSERIELEQGSPEWHEYRAKHVNASEAGALMNAGKYKPRNMVELLANRRGDAPVYQNAAMSRGTQLEPAARDHMREILGKDFQPCVYRNGRFSASMDGLCGGDAIEVKCPVSTDSDLYGIRDVASLKAIAPHYYWQVAFQFYAAGHGTTWFVVYHPEMPTHYVAIQRDDVAGDFDALISAGEEFLRHLEEGTTPETDRSDAEWESAVIEYRAAKALKDQHDAHLDDAKKRLQSLGGGRGFGLSVTRVAGKKTTEYAKAIKALCPDADMTPWQKQGEPSWTVREVKGA
jgi:putative phage-type endonuclease